MRGEEKYARAIITVIKFVQYYSLHGYTDSRQKHNDNIVENTLIKDRKKNQGDGSEKSSGS